MLRWRLQWIWTRIKNEVDIHTVAFESMLLQYFFYAWKAKCTAITSVHHVIIYVAIGTKDVSRWSRPRGHSLSNPAHFLGVIRWNKFDLTWERAHCLPLCGIVMIEDGFAEIWNENSGWATNNLSGVTTSLCNNCNQFVTMIVCFSWSPNLPRFIRLCKWSFIYIYCRMQPWKKQIIFFRFTLTAGI